MSDKLPHICFIGPNAFPLLAGDRRTELIGGAELQQVIVARGLAARGYEVSMICLDFGQEEQVQIDGIRVLRAFRREAGIPGLRFFWPRLTSIYRCLVLADADIYYQRAAGVLTGIVTAFCRRNGRIAVFAAAGNPDLDRSTSRIRLARDRWIYEYGLRRVDRVLVQNEEQARLCRLNFGVKATLIPNCYPYSGSRAEGGGKYALWVSTIRKLKRPELFLDLAAALPTQQFRMVGGPGARETSLFDAIRIRAEALPNVEFMGFMPYPEVERLFDDASILVNTSESEGFPNTFLQAWARGVPTVSFVDCGARSDGLPVGCRVQSMEEMVTCAGRLLEDEAERYRLGVRSRRFYEMNHSPERILDLYDQAFKELARGRA